MTVPSCLDHGPSVVARGPATRDRAQIDLTDAAAALHRES